MNIHKYAKMRYDGRPSILDSLRSKEIIALSLFSVVCLFLSLRGQSMILVALSFLLAVIYSIKNRAISLAVAIIAVPLYGENVSGYFQILAYMPFVVSSLFKALYLNGYKKNWVVLSCCLLLVVFSTLFGYEIDYIMLCIQIVAMAVLFCICVVFLPHDVPVVVFAYFCCALEVCAFIFMDGIDNHLIYGRMTYGENVKDLAFFCGIPLSFLLYSYLDGQNLFANNYNIIATIIKLFVTVLLVAVVFMTLARGLFLAFGLGSIVLLFLSKNKAKTYFLLFIALVFVVYLSHYITSLDLFRVERLMEAEDYSTGGGRTDIWIHYLNKINDMGFQYIILGTGPGNISRISNIEFYAHSTILDYYFSYGIIGLIAFIFVEILILRKLYYDSNKIPFVIALTFIIAYSTHGGAANMNLFMLEALLVASVKKNTYENIRSPQLV